MSGFHGHVRPNRLRQVALGCAATVCLLLASTASSAGAGTPVQPASSASLDSHLARIVEAFRERGIPGASGAAAGVGVGLHDGSVQVIIEARPGLGEEGA